MMKPATFVASLVLAGVSIPCVVAAPLAQRRFIPLHNIPSAELAIEDDVSPQQVSSRDNGVDVAASIPEIPQAEAPIPSVYLDTESLSVRIGLSPQDAEHKPLVTREEKVGIPLLLDLAHVDLSVTHPKGEIALSTRGEDEEKEGAIPVDLSELDSMRNADLHGTPLDWTFPAPPTTHSETLTARDGITSLLGGDKLNIPLINLLLGLLKSKDGKLLARNEDLALPLLDLLQLDLSVSHPTPKTVVSLSARSEQVGLPVLNKLPLLEILQRLLQGSGVKGGLLRRAQDLKVPLLDLAHLDLSVSNPGANTQVAVVSRTDDESASVEERSTIPLVDLILDLAKGRDGHGLVGGLSGLPLLQRLNLLKNDKGHLALLKRDLPVVDTVLKLTSDHNGHLGTENLVGLTKTLTSLPILSHLGLGKGGVTGGLGGLGGLGGIGGINGLLKRGEDLTIPLLDLADADLKLNGEEISTRDKIPPRPLPIVARHLDDEIPTLLAHGKNTRDTDERDATPYQLMKRRVQLSRHSSSPTGNQGALDVPEVEKRSYLHHLDFERRQGGLSAWSAFFCEGPNYRGQCTTQEYVNNQCTKIADPVYNGKLLSFLASSSNCVLYEGDTCSGSAVPIFSSVQDLRAFPHTGSFICRSNGAAAIEGITFPFVTTTAAPTPTPTPTTHAPTATATSVPSTPSGSK